MYGASIQMSGASIQMYGASIQMYGASVQMSGAFKCLKIGVGGASDAACFLLLMVKSSASSKSEKTERGSANRRSPSFLYELIRSIVADQVLTRHV
jgi:hypothetical protein